MKCSHFCHDLALFAFLLFAVAVAARRRNEPEVRTHASKIVNTVFVYLVRNEHRISLFYWRDNNILCVSVLMRSFSEIQRSAFTKGSVDGINEFIDSHSSANQMT